MESSQAFAQLQATLESYISSRKDRIKPLITDRLNFRECIAIQKRTLVKDLLRNPINALWSIPYFSIRKVIETSEKLGWDSAAFYLAKIPQSLKTDFQKEIEARIYSDLFGLPHHDGEDCELTKVLEQSSLKNILSDSDWKQLVSLSHQQVRSAVSEFCAKQNGFTDLASSGGVLLVSKWLFKDKSLDIFALGKKIASLWAKNDAASHFAFGKTLGHAFYKVAPAPPPTTTQVIITTGVAILLLALFSTAVGVLSHPLQRRLGFRQKQLENLIQSVDAKLLVELTRGLKSTLGKTREAEKESGPKAA